MQSVNEVANQKISGGFAEVWFDVERRVREMIYAASDERLTNASATATKSVIKISCENVDEADGHAIKGKYERGLTGGVPDDLMLMCRAAHR